VWWFRVLEVGSPGPGLGARAHLRAEQEGQVRLGRAVRAELCDGDRWQAASFWVVGARL
jgi:hypothetical protein